MFEEVAVAAISFRPKKYDLVGNGDRLEESFRSAAAAGASIALAPEGILEGYVVNEILSHKDPPTRMLDAAVTVRNTSVRRFCLLARELRICLVFGFAERIGDDVYNTAIFIDPAGRVRGKYHKMQFAEGYIPSWWFNRLGDFSRSVPTPYGPCGFLICNDRWNPDLARIPILDGARYLLIPSFGVRKARQDRAVLARARENGVPIVEANVGVTLIISKGEIVSLSRKINAITMGTISIPAPNTVENREKQEERFLDWRRKEMPKRCSRYQRKQGIKSSVDPPDASPKYL